MTKSDIITHVAHKTGLSKTDTQLVIDIYMQSIKEAVGKGERVYLRGFGTFLAKERGARMYHDINVRRKTCSPPHRIAAFRPSDLFLKNP